MLSLGNSYSLDNRDRIGSGLTMPAEFSFIKSAIKDGKMCSLN